MVTSNHRPPGLSTLAGRILSTGAGALQNRVELFSLEWQQERARLTTVMMMASAFVVFATAASIFLAGVLVVIMPDSLRPWAAGVLGILYSLGAWWLWRALKTILSRASFPETIEQFRRDTLCFDTSKIPK